MVATERGATGKAATPTRRHGRVKAQSPKSKNQRRIGLSGASFHGNFIE
jgi:hypothetical protein